MNNIFKIPNLLLYTPKIHLHMGFWCFFFNVLLFPAINDFYGNFTDG